MAVKVFFWISLAVIFYSYIGYGFLLVALIQLKQVFNRKKNSPAAPFTPPVTLVVAAFNEAAFIRQKIDNTLAIDYPADRFHILIVTDGSSDETPDIVASYAPRVQLLHSTERKGKVNAINRAMDQVTTPFVVFCDANTFLNEGSIKAIVQHYQDEKIGAVAGEKKVVDLTGNTNAAGAGEGLYWKYESTLKKLDAQYYSVVGAAGELFSIRTRLFEHTDTDILLDDFMISMNICKKGYRVMYEPTAYAMEAPSYSMLEEQKRKIRISAGAFQSMYLLLDVLNPFKYGKLSFQYISHRVLRWTLCPLLLPVVLLLNIVLVLQGAGLITQLILLAQVLFYTTAIAGWLLAQKNIKVKILYVPYYFFFMNAALYIGFGRFLNKKQTVLWEKAKRKS